MTLYLMRSTFLLGLNTHNLLCLQLYLAQFFLPLVLGSIKTSLTRMIYVMSWGTRSLSSWTVGVAVLTSFFKVMLHRMGDNASSWFRPLLISLVYVLTSPIISSIFSYIFTLLSCCMLVEWLRRYYLSPYCTPSISPGAVEEVIAGLL